MAIEEFISSSPEETLEIGIEIGKKALIPSIFCFYGDLAAGKTTFMKGFVFGSIGIEKNEVNSPTFTYLNIYKGTSTIYHFDAYRLSSCEEFSLMGFEEYFYKNGITCIEWSENIKNILPLSHIAIHIDHIGFNQRKISLHS